MDISFISYYWDVYIKDGYYGLYISLLLFKICGNKFFH